jgi:hypothetical protein
MTDTKKEMQTMSLQKSSSQEQMKTYFEKVFELKQTGKDFPVNLDEVWPLVYTRKQEAIRALKEMFFENIDYQTLRRNAQRGAASPIDYYLSLQCMEFFIARKERAVFEIYRQVFHKAIEGEISKSQGIPQFGTRKEGEVYLAKLSTGTIKAYYANGEQHYSLGGIMKFLGFAQSGGGLYARKYNGAIKVKVEKQDMWFVNYDWISKLCTSRNPNYELVSTIFRDLFNVNITPDGSEYAFRYTDKRMLDLIALINQVIRPAGIKEKLLNIIMEGRI